MPFDVWSLLLGFIVIAATSLFFSLSGYNKKHDDAMKKADECVGKPTTSLFELPAFRGKKFQVNPFQNTTWRLTFYEQLKLSIMGVTVFPIRLVCAVTSFLLTCLVVAVLIKSGMKKLARPAVSCGGRIILFWCGFYSIKVKGKQSPGVGVQISNHGTFFDGIVWAVFSTTRIFAEESNFKNPVMQVLAKGLDIVLFDRGDQEARRQARKIMASSAADAVAGEAPPVFVFPTGTTTNQEVMITFKDGAFAPGLPVQPAILHYRFCHCDPSWVFSGPGSLMLLFRLLSQFVNYLDIEYLDVCTPNDEEKADPQKFARRVQHVVASAMGVPETEHAVEDVQFELAAVKANLPAEVGVVGFPALKESFCVDANKIKQQLHVFKEMDKNGSGLVEFEDFKAAFTRGFHEPSQGQTRFLRELFDQLTAGSEKLDFRKFLIGLALVNENEYEKGVQSPSSTSIDLVKVKSDIYAQLAFAAFASKCDDRISWQEFSDLWNWLYPEPSGEQPTGGKAVTQSARVAFESIVSQPESVEITFEEFSEHAKKNPDFEKSLRQAFFSRLATDFAPSAQKRGQKRK